MYRRLCNSNTIIPAFEGLTYQLQRTSRIRVTTRCLWPH